jgi:adenosine kinase
MTDKVDNQIWGFFYGANEYVEELSLKPFATAIDIVLIGPQGARGSMHFVKECVDMNLAYMFDPGFILTQVTNDELKYGIAHAKYVVGNDYEISIIKSRVENFADLMKDKILITTLGEKGAIIHDKGQEITINPAKVKIVIDPSGAGDAWRSGFLAGIQRNLDLQTCGEMGALAAAFVVEHYGPQEHLFTKEEFAKRYKETYNKDLAL